MKDCLFSFRVALSVGLFVCATLAPVAIAPQSARAQTTMPAFPDLSNTPTSQIGTPIALYIKCTLLQQTGPPIPAFETECAGALSPPDGGSSVVGGTLTGEVIGGTTTPATTPTTTTDTLTGTVVASSSGTLNGTVVSGSSGGGIGGGDGGGGGGGSGSSGSGGGSGGGGSSSGQVLGASMSTVPDGGVGGYAPAIPNTGAGGAYVATWVTLVLSGIFSIGGLTYLAHSAGGFHRRF